MTLYEKYINDVLNNPDDYNKYVRASVHRHLNDLKKTDFIYYFNKEKADRVIKIVKLLRHTQGSYGGKHFDLQPYQAFILAMLFGWVRKSNYTRRFLKAYIETPRKSGKSEFAAAVQIYMTFFDGEFKPQTFAVATKRDQAKYVYDAARSMANMLSLDSQLFKKRVRVMQYQINEIDTDGYITKLTADAKTEDGANPHCAIIDEYHAHDNDELLKVIETGVGSRTQPLILIITTAGFNKESACYQFRSVVCQILDGVIENENLFGIIWTPDENDDWHDPKVWKKINPNYGNTPKEDQFNAFYQAAITEGSSAEVEFKTKNLNMWVDAAKTWITKSVYDACFKQIEHEELEGLRCIVGIDLSSRVDLTAVCYFFPTLKYYYVDYYCPLDKINKGRRVDGVDYYDWVKKKYIKATPGNVIDYEYIISDVLTNAEKYNVEIIGYDPMNADLIIPKFEQLGLVCGSVRQGFITLSPPTKKFEMMVLGKEIYHSGDPITGWCLANVVLSTDAAGNIKPDKAKSSNKIDGVVSVITALAAYMHVEQNADHEDTLEDIKKMYG